VFPAVCFQTHLTLFTAHIKASMRTRPQAVHAGAACAQPEATPRNFSRPCLSPCSLKGVLILSLLLLGVLPMIARPEPRQSTVAKGKLPAEDPLTRALARSIALKAARAAQVGTDSALDPASQRFRCVRCGSARRIPRVLHQSWRSREVPRALEAHARTWRSLMPDGWQFALHTDDENDRLVSTRYAWLQAAYSSMSPIQKADVT
jgi:hypothetical protein